MHWYDDINELLIKGEGKLRSIISQEDFSKRALYKDANQNLKRRSTFAGTTNYMDLLRNENENRYMIFKIEKSWKIAKKGGLLIYQIPDLQLFSWSQKPSY